jgi:predicted component of type VI protein secretion system
VFAMDNNMSKKLAILLNRIPKKDLDKNIEKAKEILSKSNKDDLNAFLNSKPVADLLGKDKDKISDAINKNGVNLNDLNDFKSEEIK